ncbi:MAG: hypothetical protein JSV04_01830, partial [Candidatus Heimdallarchaeota archaeon]
EELSEILETPTENVANIRKKINLVNLRESTDTSVSILEDLPRKQLQTLAVEQISTIFDFLTTSDEQLGNILEIDLEQVTKMKDDLNFENIKSIKEEKMIPLVKVSLFDRNTVRKLARLGVESLADLYYVASPKTFTDSDIDWQDIVDVKIILDLPIEISQIPTRKEIKALRKAKINSVLDLMMESHERLCKRTGIPEEKLKNIQDSINVREIITLIQRVTISKIDFPAKYRSTLEREKINTIYELLNHPDETIFLVKEGEKQLRIDRKRWSHLFSVMATPLSLILGSNRDLVKKLKQKHIETLKDAYSTTLERMETILEEDPSDFFSELQALSFTEISQFLNIPISFIPKLSLNWLQILVSHSMTRIGDIFSQKIGDLAGILETSVPKTRTMVLSINMPVVIKCLEEEMLPLKKLSVILSSNVIEELEARDISSIQEFILHDRSDLDVAELDKIYEVFDAPINHLSEELTLNEFRKLSQNGISTISDFFFAPNNSLAKLLGMDTSEIYRLKNEFDFQPPSEMAEVDTPLKSFIAEGYIDFEEIEKLGIRMLEDLLFIELETLDVSDQEKTRLANLKDALNSSLAYYNRIPPQYVIPLALNGVTSIMQLVTTDFSQLEDLMGVIVEEEYQNARSSINLVDILTHKKTDTEFRVKLSSLRAFTPKQLEQIQKLGIDNVVDLYFRLDTERLKSKSLINPIETVKRVLEKPVAILPSVQSSFPQKIPLLYNAGITSIIEFLFWPKDDLAELLEIKRYEISKYRKIDLGALKRKKNLGTPIENFVRIPEENVNSLKELGIDNIEDLYFHLSRYNFIPDAYVPKKLISACISDLESPVVRLADLPIPVAQELVKQGINRIIDFLYWPVDDLKQVYGLSEAKIKRIKSNIRLRRKQEVIGRLDSYMKKD